MKPILFTFAFAATLAAQNFIQMSDPQVGMFTKEAEVDTRVEQWLSEAYHGDPTSGHS